MSTQAHHATAEQIVDVSSAVAQLRAAPSPSPTTGRLASHQAQGGNVQQDRPASVVPESIGRAMEGRESGIFRLPAAEALEGSVLLAVSGETHFARALGDALEDILSSENK